MNTHGLLGFGFPIVPTVPVDVGTDADLSISPEEINWGQFPEAPTEKRGLPPWVLVLGIAAVAWYLLRRKG